MGLALDGFLRDAHLREIPQDLVDAGQHIGLAEAERDADIGFDPAFAGNHVGLEPAFDHADVEGHLAQEVGGAVTHAAVQRRLHLGVAEVAGYLGWRVGLQARHRFEPLHQVERDGAGAFAHMDVGAVRRASSP